MSARLHEFASFGPGIFLRLALMFMLIASAFYLLERRHRRFSNFLKTAAFPFDLAVFRVIVFSTLFFVINVNRIAVLSALPNSWLTPPTGFKPFLSLLPPSPHLCLTLGIAFKIFAVLAAFGAASRLSLPLSTILFLYLQGVNYSYGKVDHQTHLVLWSAIVLCFSRCSDVWSIDALLVAMKRADRGMTAPPLPSVAYGFPLRLSLLGIAYLFPGFWKVVEGGPAWFAPANLGTLIYARIIGTPAVHLLARYAPAFKIGMVAASFTAVGFEITFIFLILFPRYRVPAALLGEFFHFMNLFLLGINFWSMQLMYAALIPWAAIMARIGKRLFPVDMSLVYDGTCGICRRTIAILRTGDFYGRTTFIASTETERLKEAGLEHLIDTGYLADFTAVLGDQVFKGYDAYRLLLPRIAGFSFLTLVFFLPYAEKIGRQIYGSIASSRTCSVTSAVHSAAHPGGTVRLSSTLRYTAAGLLIINGLFGLSKIEFGWPVACFPSLGHAQDGTLYVVEARVQQANGTTSTYMISNDPVISRKLGDSFDGRLTRLLTGKAFQAPSAEVRALWQIYSSAKAIPSANDKVEIVVSKRLIDFNTLNCSTIGNYRYADYDVARNQVSVNSNLRFVGL